MSKIPRSVSKLRRFIRSRSQRGGMHLGLIVLFGVLYAILWLGIAGLIRWLGLSVSSYWIWGSALVALLLAAFWSHILDGYEALRYPLIHASFLGQVDRVQELLHRGANPNESGPRGETALHAAVRSGNGELVSLLLEAGAVAGARNELGCTPADFAEQSGQRRLQQKLLEFDAPGTGGKNFSA